MRIVHIKDIVEKPATRKRVVKAIKKGKVFVYPTDTLYGLGCDAGNHKAVKRIRSIKTGDQSFSVIAPSLGWIRKNMHIRNPRHLGRLPGPYTLIMKMKKRVVSSQVARKTLGVRIPDHPISSVIEEAGVPFVTTSANMSGETPIWSTHGIPEFMEKKVDYAIHDDILKGPASTVIDVTGKRAKRVR